MKKYLFLTIIFAVNHAGRRKAQISTEKPHTSSINSLPKTSLDTKEKIRKLEEQNKNLLMTLNTIKDKIANKENLEKQNKDLMKKIDELNEDKRNIINQMEDKENKNSILEKELLPKCRIFRMENKLFKYLMDKYDYK